jgi:hypothetical protein
MFRTSPYPGALTTPDDRSPVMASRPPEADPTLPIDIPVPEPVDPPVPSPADPGVPGVEPSEPPPPGTDPLHEGP